MASTSSEDPYLNQGVRPKTHQQLGLKPVRVKHFKQWTAAASAESVDSLDSSPDASPRLGGAKHRHKQRVSPRSRHGAALELENWHKAAAAKPRSEQFAAELVDSDSDVTGPLLSSSFNDVTTRSETIGQSRAFRKSSPKPPTPITAKTNGQSNRYVELSHKLALGGRKPCVTSPVFADKDVGRPIRPREMVLVLMLLCFVAMTLGLILVMVLDKINAIGRGGREPTSRECNSTECTILGVQMFDQIDSRIKPCSNFYRYACGGRSAVFNGIVDRLRDDVTDDDISWSVADDIAYRADEQVRDLLEMTSHAGDSFFRTAQLAYRKCVSADAVNETSERLLQELTGWPYSSAGWNAIKTVFLKIQDVVLTVYHVCLGT